MRTNRLSLLLGLTSTVAVTAPLSAQAASFNFDSIQNIQIRPIESQDKLFFNGESSDNQGYTGFNSANPSVVGRVGHKEISKNSPATGFAPYYTTGRHASPASTGATRSTTLQNNNNSGFSNFFNYLNTNNISVDSIGFSYGQKNIPEYTKTWNLGDDILGKDWFASPETTLEERIYQANPNDVEVFITYGNTKIVNLGYTPFYSFLEYGPTPETADDSEAVLTEPVGVYKVAGLDPFATGLADAFLQDVTNAGGNIQVVYQDIQVPDLDFSSGNGFNVASIRFPVELRAVSGVKVSEPTALIGISILGALALIDRLKKQNNSTKCRIKTL
jgi:hypothetical protein